MRPDASPGGLLRVALAPDMPLVVAGITALLQSPDSGVVVVDLPVGPARAAPVDVVLYDPQCYRPPAGARGAEGGPTLIALSWTLRSDAVAAARQQGAAGYLSKELGAQELVRAIRAIHAGTRSPYVVSARKPGSRSRRADGLTERELEILSMITEGFTNEEIAGRLYLSINSVKTYIRTAYRKIGATRRPQAVLWGVANGLAPHRDPAAPQPV